MIDKLHYISQQPQHGSHLTAIELALKAGCRWIQLRVKNQPADAILEYAVEAVKRCNRYGARLVVNDHPEIAFEAGAYGVHLGLDDMSITAARKIVGKKMIIGGTANTFSHIEQRAAEGADYIGLGPFRFTATKQKLSPILGLPGYEIIMQQMRCANIQIPVIAIGGIVPGDISSLIQTGVYGVAVSGVVTHAFNPAPVVKKIYQELNTHPRIVAD